MYRDSPSWSEEWISKAADGSLMKGGQWDGGRAYITCSRKAVELARRPQNLAAVKKLTGANSYFIDTTYAAGLYECFDPLHPLTKAGDMQWKQAISDYARGVFGSFGSEDGREWAIPHADYFEGITGVSGTYFANKNLLRETGGVAIPLFELVYHDAIAAYGKYGYDAAESAEYVLRPYDPRPDVELPQRSRSPVLEGRFGAANPALHPPTGETSRYLSAPATDGRKACTRRTVS